MNKSLIAPLVFRCTDGGREERPLSQLRTLSGIMMMMTINLHL